MITVTRTRAAPYHEWTLECGDVLWRMSDYYNGTGPGNGAIRIRHVDDNGTLVYAYGGTGYLIGVDQPSVASDWIGGGHGNASHPLGVWESAGLDGLNDTADVDHWTLTYQLLGYYDGGAPLLLQSYTWTMDCDGDLIEHVINTALEDFHVNTEYRGSLPGPGVDYTGGGYDTVNEGTGYGQATTTVSETLANSDTITASGDFTFVVSNDESGPIYVRDQSNKTIKAYIKGTARDVLALETWSSTTTYQYVGPPP